jgi:hypothetical protein
MSHGEVIVTLIGCAIILLLPPKWDPAIRLKEWLEKDR